MSLVRVCLCECVIDWLVGKFFAILAILYPVFSEIVSEYDQEIQQSQTADKPMAFAEEQPYGHNKTPGR